MDNLRAVHLYTGRLVQVARSMPGHAGMVSVLETELLSAMWLVAVLESPKHTETSLQLEISQAGRPLYLLIMPACLLFLQLQGSHSGAALTLEMGPQLATWPGAALQFQKLMAVYLQLAALQVSRSAHLLIMLDCLLLSLLQVSRSTTPRLTQALQLQAISRASHKVRQLDLHLDQPVARLLVNLLDLLTALFRLPTLVRWLVNRLASLMRLDLPQAQARSMPGRMRALLVLEIDPPPATRQGKVSESLKRTAERPQLALLQAEPSAYPSITPLHLSFLHMIYTEHSMGKPAPLPLLRYPRAECLQADQLVCLIALALSALLESGELCIYTGPNGVWII